MAKTFFQSLFTVVDDKLDVLFLKTEILYLL